VFSSGTAVNFDENGTGVVYTAVATDADGDAIDYSLSGADAALFDIDASTGELTFVTPPDFESPSSASGNNVYQVTVIASDGGNSIEREVAITVTNENDNAPVVTSAASVNYREGGTGTVYTATASDADGALNPITYILGGVDAALFDIDANTGEVNFKL